jgi:hypothetical protein
LTAEFAELFLKDSPKLIAETREALTRGDAKAPEHAAHSLKGSVSNFAAWPHTPAALKLETLGREVTSAMPKRPFERSKNTSNCSNLDSPISRRRSGDDRLGSEEHSAQASDKPKPELRAATRTWLGAPPWAASPLGPAYLEEESTAFSVAPEALCQWVRAVQAG